MLDISISSMRYRTLMALIDICPPHHPNHLGIGPSTANGPRPPPSTRRAWHMSSPEYPGHEAIMCNISGAGRPIALKSRP
ncbi:hypothetical protein B0T18DRAFT_202708 [Schizothecium vesticola]|uniref:Uncharacterized protein n=1 Tax=Schizothecium vesticola TaxID=314040 RepID=A0AA40BTK1_9PEZI|nr:hypothetical protein B0T18DRAFT_202708 [Schizothecium vesticola]